MVADTIVCCAEIKDIPDILEMQNSFLLKNKTIRAAEKDGFVVYPIYENELRELISSNYCFLVVARSNERVVGYALAYDLNTWKKIKKKWDKHSFLPIFVKEHLSADRVLYFRQIVRDNNFKGVGNRLEEEVYSVARSKGFKFVVAEILESPLLNKKSKEVHEEEGYVKIGCADYFDGNFWGLYEKKL